MPEQIGLVQIDKIQHMIRYASFDQLVDLILRQ